MDTATDVTMMVKYSATDAAIVDMGERFNHLEITPGDAKSYELVRLAINEVRSMRVGVEKERKVLKEDALRYGQRVDAEAKRITVDLRKIEDGLKVKKAVIDDEKVRLKEEAERKEREREERLRKKIDTIAVMAGGLTNASAEEIEKVIKSVNAVVIQREEFGEFFDNAETVKGQILGSLDVLLSERRQFEEERIRLAEEQAKLAQQRAEQERKAEEERKKLETERKKAETERKKVEVESEAKRKVEQAKLDAEKEKIAKEKAAVEQEKFRIQAEKEAKEKAQRELKEQEEKQMAARRKAEAKAKRDAKLAPDKEKMRIYSGNIKNAISESPQINDKDIRKTMDIARKTLIGCLDDMIKTISLFRKDDHG